MKEIVKESNIVSPKKPINIVSDPDDNKFVEAAIEGNAQYIISQDKHLLSLRECQGIKIITPKEFLKIVEED